MTNWMVRSVRIATVASILAVTTAAAAASDLFLKLDGINGESVAAGHVKEIDIESFSWGASRKASTGFAGGGGAAKAAIQDFTVVKRVDAASPELFKALLEGRTIKNATFVVQKSSGPSGGKGGVDSLKITLENVQITDIKVSGDEAQNPAESVSLKFGKLTYEYTPIDAKGGKGPTISFTWDVAKGKS